MLFRSLLAAVVLSSSGAVRADGQLPPIAPGPHSLMVRGWYGEEEMHPWDAEYSMDDTVVEGTPALRMSYNSRRPEGRWLFRFETTWEPRTGRMISADWNNDGRVMSRCNVRLRDGHLTGSSSNSAELTPLSVTGDVIPDWALGGYLARRKLAAGDTVRVSLVRCLTVRGADALELVPFAGVVESVTAKRGIGGPMVDAWRVQAPGLKAAGVTIAKSDGLVLHTRTIQGSVGYSEDTYVGGVTSSP